MDSTTESPPSKRTKTSPSSSCDQPDKRDPAVDPTSTLSEMSNAIKSLASNQERLLSDNANLVQRVQTLTNQITALQQDLNAANRTLTSIHYGTRRLSGVFRFPSIGNDANNASRDEPAAAAPSPPILPPRGLDPSHTDETPSIPIATEKQEQQSKSQAKMGEKFSDNNLFLVDILIKLKECGGINVLNISKSNYPRDIVSHSGNGSYVKYCLELVEFVANSDVTLAECIKTLADQTIRTDDDIIKNAAEMLVDACAEKIEEFDSKKVRKKTAIGFGSRIRDYKKMIIKVKERMHPGQLFTTDSIELMGREELDKLQTENYDKYYENQDETDL